MLFSIRWSALLATAVALLFPLSVNAQSCPLDRPVVFGGLDWDSARFHNAVAARLIRSGFGCETTEIPGSTIPLTNGLARGDVDVLMEVWRNNLAEVWAKAAERGTVTDIGPNFPDAEQGWYVPRYVVEGPDAPAPDLKSVHDLPRYTELFRDREEPDKGRFYNCIAGWSCEIVNSRKLEAYGLDEYYTNFLPGTGEALSAAVAGAIKRKRPILFYYWSPSWLDGLYDFVKLEEPEYNAAAFEALRDPDKPLQGGVAYALAAVAVGVNTEFSQDAPELIRVLTAYNTTSAMVSGALGQMRENDLTPQQAADLFLQENTEHWESWLPDENRTRVLADLAMN